MDCSRTILNAFAFFIVFGIITIAYKFQENYVYSRSKAVPQGLSITMALIKLPPQSNLPVITILLINFNLMIERVIF